MLIKVEELAYLDHDENYLRFGRNSAFDFCSEFSYDIVFHAVYLSCRQVSLRFRYFAPLHLRTEIIDPMYSAKC